MTSLALVLNLGRIQKLKTEIKCFDDNLQDLIKKVKEIEERKRYLKRQLENTMLQDTYVKKLLS